MEFLQTRSSVRSTLPTVLTDSNSTLETSNDRNSTMVAAAVVNCLAMTDDSEMCCSVKFAPARGATVTSSLTMFLMGFFGNILALTVLRKSRAESQRTVFYTLLTGLILTDLFGQVSTSILPLVTYALSSVNITSNQTKICWIGGKPTCHLHAFFMIAVSLNMPCFVAFMSLERVLCLKRWYLYSITVTKKRAYAVIVVIWTVAVAFALLPHLGIGTYALQFPGTWCFLDSHTKGNMSGYTLTYAGINCLLILLIIVCNVIVIVTLLQVRRTRRNLTGGALNFRKKYSADLSSSTGPFSYVRGKQQLPQQSTRRRISGTILCACARLHGNLLKDLEIQMVVLLGAITVAFTVCWLPLMIQIIINEVTEGTNFAADLRAIRMASINQILDPWIYILFRKSVLTRTASCVVRCLRLRPPPGQYPRHPGGGVTATQRGASSRHQRMQKVVMPPMMLAGPPKGEESPHLSLQIADEDAGGSNDEERDPVLSVFHHDVRICACSCHQEPQSHTREACQRARSNCNLARAQEAEESRGCWPSKRKQSVQRSASLARPPPPPSSPQLIRQISLPVQMKLHHAEQQSQRGKNDGSNDSGISDAVA